MILYKKLRSYPKLNKFPDIYMFNNLSEVYDTLGKRLVNELLKQGRISLILNFPEFPYSENEIFTI